MMNSSKSLKVNFYVVFLTYGPYDMDHMIWFATKAKFEVGGQYGLL